VDFQKFDAQNGHVIQKGRLLSIKGRLCSRTLKRREKKTYRWHPANAPNCVCNAESYNLMYICDEKQSSFAMTNHKTTFEKKLNQ